MRDTGARGGLKQRGPTWEAASWVGDPPETFWSRALAASGSPSLPTGSVRCAVLETEGPWPASQFPISTKKLGSNPVLSFQRLVSKTNTLTVHVPTFQDECGVDLFRPDISTPDQSISCV